MCGMSWTSISGLFLLVPLSSKYSHLLPRHSRNSKSLLSISTTTRLYIMLTILQRRWVCFCPSERCFWMESTTNSILEAITFYHLFVKLTLQTGTMFCMLA
ncbi:hypothetical protein F5878DRAFT_605517 [Lentinula raphanica]|uniref:Secreted protein n=1 Tax=Lentinula raphanica TaxID=153919 RepID=A0AA38PHX9_9AGAR|nr:hypothetical protein F5878DRAFT_605517 [Lentinula raphanica]